MKMRIFILGLLITTASCTKFLELKPDKRLFVPSKTDDLWALLNNVSVMNYSSPIGIGEMASDNFLLTENIWKAVPDLQFRSKFIWERFPVEPTLWRSHYQRISYANIVLEHMGGISMSEADRAKIAGTAMFARAIAHYEILLIFAMGYRDGGNILGIPMRMTSDINVPAERMSQSACYRIIINDLEEAVSLLPELKSEFPTLPNKTAALALLARLYLNIGEYENALNMAKEALKINNELMNFNEMIFTRSYPFEPFNKEVLYFALMTGSALMEGRARVDTNLYLSYAINDLRKQAYFTKATDGYYMFTGDFSQLTSAAKFCGLTIAELILTEAECLIRSGHVKEAVNSMNKLIQNRYAKPFPLLSEDLSKEEVLKSILEERRKELVFRGLRWSDLRRLENEGIVRHFEGRDYAISHQELKDFAFLIPDEVIDRSDIKQN